MIVLYKINRQLIIHGIGANTKVSSNWVMLNEKCVNMMKYKSIGGKFVLGVKEICSREVKIYKYSRKKYARKKREKSRLHENEYTAKVGHLGHRQSHDRYLSLLCPAAPYAILEIKTDRILTHLFH